MCQWFTVSQFSISDFKHVWIIPSSDFSIFFETNLLLKVFQEGCPMIGDISSGSPRISNSSSPFPDFLLTPVANGVKNMSTGFIQRFSHSVIPKFCSHIGRVAIVVFKVVNSKIKQKNTPIWHMSVRRSSQIRSCLVFLGMFDFLHHCINQTSVLCCEHTL